MDSDVLLVLAVIKLADWSDLFDAAPVEPKRNCPECGARNSVTDTFCGYCGRSMGDG